jgi:hypothetical protein
MGRELKRVPLDFKWEENKPWEGFLNPHYERCQSCGGTGNTTAYHRLSDLVSLLMLSGDDSVKGKCHPYFNEAPLFSTQGKVCGKDMATLTAGLSGMESKSPFGYGVRNLWSAIKKIIEAAGLTEEWGVCPACNGEGIPKDKQEAYNNWERVEPPAGEGYQIWETVSEGSPISPVFATPEELASHMAGKKWGADHGSSYESWLNFINGPGWSVSMIMDESGIRVGPNAS